MADHREDGRLSDYVLQVLNQAELHLPGISQAALRAELFDTMRRWFDETNMWQETITFAVVPNVLDYSLVPTGGIIIRLIGVIDQNKVSQPALMSKLGTVSFVNPYSQVQTFSARVVKNVTAPFTNHGVPECPAQVLQVWGTYIRDGLVGYLMAQPAKSWSNPQESGAFIGRFFDGVGRARGDVARRNGIGISAWAFPQTWRTRGQRGGVSVTGSPW